ncbi:MAG: SET domain-containing protein [Saprospiraceae bacterium]|nr:SET domain-containing protein [Saprospiraceae bacterium]MCB0623710.1 SET domain-containing protein [Saprospiraceae bacterium]MCB0675260.1 SET domain-containing protein [Saprospiraceae bacterium]MCB0679629.1 SET domain-containing protein [Saprospiraceae bacterium]
MIHPNTQIRIVSEEIGYGVFATEFIPAGTIVYVKDLLEVEVTQSAFAILPLALQEVVNKYSYIDEHGVRIVSWDFAKYVNHCCQPNTMSTGYGFEIALRDIQAGEEITDEYALFNLEEDMSLSCSKPGCRGRVSPVDVDLYAQQWDQQIRRVLDKVFDLPQPLLPFIDPQTVASLHDYRANPEHYRSVRRLKYEPAAGNHVQKDRLALP